MANDRFKPIDMDEVDEGVVDDILDNVGVDDRDAADILGLPGRD